MTDPDAGIPVIQGRRLGVVPVGLFAFGDGRWLLPGLFLQCGSPVLALRTRHGHPSRRLLAESIPAAEVTRPGHR
jgi:hypothetical protein